MKRFDAEIVREFYSNAYLERQERHKRKTMVRGRWIRYSPQAINDFLENPIANKRSNAIIRGYVAGRKDLAIGRWQQCYTCQEKGIN